jgi:hypothetical protein
MRLMLSVSSLLRMTCKSRLQRRVAFIMLDSFLSAMREITWNPHTFMGHTWFDGVHRDFSHGLVVALKRVGVIVEVKGSTLCTLESLVGPAEPGTQRPPAGKTQLVKAQRG